MRGGPSCSTDYAERSLMNFPCADKLVGCTCAASSFLGLQNHGNIRGAGCTATRNLRNTRVPSDVRYVCPEDSTHRSCSVGGVGTGMNNHAIAGADSVAVSCLLKIVGVHVGAICSLCGSAERIPFDHYYIRVLFITLFNKLHHSVRLK